MKPVNRYNWILPDWPLFSRQKGPAREILEGWNVLGRNHNIGTVRTRVILHADEHPIKSLSSLVEVIRLEIERCLCEALFIGKVVVCIDDMERIRMWLSLLSLVLVITVVLLSSLSQSRNTDLHGGHSPT